MEPSVGEIGDLAEQRSSRWRRPRFHDGIGFADRTPLTATDVAAAIRWLPWRPSWRVGSIRSWIDAVKAPLTLAKGWWWMMSATVIAVVLAVIVISVVAVLVAVVTAVAVGFGLLASAVAHLALRQPFLVEATSRDGSWRGWWVVGLQRARRVRRDVERCLAAGEDLAAVGVAESDFVMVVDI